MAHSRDTKEASVLISTKYPGLYQNGVIYLCVLSPLFIISECHGSSGGVPCHRAGGWREANEMARGNGTGKMEMIIVQSRSTWLHCQVLHRHECCLHSILTRALDFTKDGPPTGHLFLASALCHFSHLFVKYHHPGFERVSEVHKIPQLSASSRACVLVQNWQQANSTCHALHCSWLRTVSLLDCTHSLCSCCERSTPCAPGAIACKWKVCSMPSVDSLVKGHC